MALFQCFGIHGGLCWGTWDAAEWGSGLVESIGTWASLETFFFFNLIHSENAAETTQQRPFVKLMGFSSLNVPHIQWLGASNSCIFHKVPKVLSLTLCALVLLSVEMGTINPGLHSEVF